MIQLGRKKKAVMEKNEDGVNYLTEKYLIELCNENEQYSTPKYNDYLYLHYKGLRKIEALDNYVNLNSLWLENNSIRQISGISHLEKLTMLYLQHNHIERIDGISTLVNLVTLNLSYNSITVIENLSGCTSLETLDLSNNMIIDYKDCRGLEECKSLTSVNLSENKIEYDDRLLDFFFQFQNFIYFNFEKNPARSKIHMYRK